MLTGPNQESGTVAAPRLQAVDFAQFSVASHVHLTGGFSRLWSSSAVIAEQGITEPLLDPVSCKVNA